MSHLWGSVFIIGGGAITFLCIEPNLIKVIIGSFGIIFLPVLMNAYFIRRNEIMKIIRDISGGEE